MHMIYIPFIYDKLVLKNHLPLAEYGMYGYQLMALEIIKNTSYIYMKKKKQNKKTKKKTAVFYILLYNQTIYPKNWGGGALL